MKIMVINEKKGYYINPKKSKSGSVEMVDIEKITKEDIFDILDYMIDNDVEMDECKDNDSLPNPAQATIYKSLYTNFNGVINSKATIMSDVDNKFKEAENKYIKDIE